MRGALVGVGLVAGAVLVGMASALTVECVLSVPEDSVGRGTRRPTRILVVGAGGVVVFAMLTGHFGPSLQQLVVTAPLAFGLVVLSAVDLESHRVPNRVLIPTAVVVTLSMGVCAGVTGSWAEFASAAVASVTALAALLAVWRVSFRSSLGGAGLGFGFGDVRLGALVGLAAGWAGSPADAVLLAALALGVACASGLVVGLVALLASGTCRIRFAFGPCLAGGALWSVLWGPGLAGALVLRPR
jgi:leader peptidase (prepilin peptidase)/N-methyltransferase